jgi:DNA-binding SARP family transcriptional activator
MLNRLRTLAIQQLRALDADTRLIVIHPNYAEQHVVLGEFLSENAVYVRFDGLKLTAAEMMAQLQSALDTQAGDLPLDKVGLLILDECDRAVSTDLDAFLSGLMPRVGKTRVLMFSRAIPRSLLTDAALRDQTALIPSDESAMLWDYAQAGGEQTLLEVRSFGEGRVYLNGRMVDDWDGLLPRSLFFYLVDRGMTTRNEIFETFWPALPVREATNVFHVTKRKISEVLGIDLTTYWSGFYRISPTIHLSYDVVLFTDLAQRSAVAPADEAVELLSRAVALYEGHFLSGSEAEWVKLRRGELAQSYGEALSSLAKAKQDVGHYQEALGLYLQAAANNRQREDLVSNVMQLYRELGMHADALAVYERLTGELRDDLGVMPAPQLQELAALIRREMGRELV